MPFHHIPVLCTEVVAGLVVRPGGLYLDATVGGGGHSAAILAADPTAQLVAVDRDPTALNAAREHLAIYSERVQFWAGNFAAFDLANIDPAIFGLGRRFDGILADLGVSSAQLDVPERGFSFRHEAPLDMRMDPDQDLTAAELINTASETELADIFYQYGEERFSRRIARGVVAARPLQTTTQLVEVVFRCLPRFSKRGDHGRIHPATRVFQALRIAVNQELKALETFLQRAPDWLNSGGRIGAISFHSLEDRIVKHRLREDERLKVLTKKPIWPQEAELEANPRARSARLRLAERLILDQ
ncbi:16S rRNA (cytosine(1402)-N(4))-methyltransferase RsmH [Leptolyngbya sp. FACHB-261]|uniref:16S rRNA (cytosine(1402)-N(4))-methyltransferase RsmH n=1 Tax=Leptolyngbya sp. FACHB-261 TaxID=2692806 RepID=UPI0018F059E8